MRGVARENLRGAEGREGHGPRVRGDDTEASFQERRRLSYEFVVTRSRDDGAE